MNHYEMSWKAVQRDWLVNELRELIERWQIQSNSPTPIFSPDESVDRIARGRTGGCASLLAEILAKLS